MGSTSGLGRVARGAGAVELAEHVGVGDTAGVGGPETDVFEARA